MQKIKSLWGALAKFSLRLFLINSDLVQLLDSTAILLEKQFLYIDKWIWI
jgi:hypothetical protein